MTSHTDIKKYYARRASEYEKVYTKPERQDELSLLKDRLPKWFSGHSVLEIACGTGYWTEFIAKAALSIHSTDINEEVLEIARQKDYGQCSVQFDSADAYSLSNIDGSFTAGFHGFWWSHIPKSHRFAFLKAFHAKLAYGATVVMLENLYVHGSNNPLAPETDEEGNTFSLRQLDDGSKWKVLKNYPEKEEVIHDLSLFATNIEYIGMKYYWLAKYSTKQ